MKIVLASNNPGKLAELRALFAPLGVELIAQDVFGVPEAPEPYSSFLENALTKAAMPRSIPDCPLSPTMRACASTHWVACPV